MYFSLFFNQGEHQAAVDIYDEEVKRICRFELYDDFSIRIVLRSHVILKGKEREIHVL